jgi:AcrR family transcriptional regulator
MTGSTATRWRRRKNARPSEILDAALAVFAERGFAATRMDDIAERAGVTKGTIYLYFESKDAVFRSLVQEAIGATIGRFLDQARHFEGPASELLRNILRGIGQFICKTDRVVLPKIILAEAGNFPGLAEFYRREVIDKGLALLQSIIARGIASGEFREISREHAAKLCIAPLLLGAFWRTTFARFDEVPYDLDGMIETHIDVLLRGLAAERGGHT